MTDTPGFVAFWQTYPRKVGKGVARRKFEIATRSTLATTILVALDKQIAAGTFDREAKFIPHPATWLHGERWEDEIVIRQRPTFRNAAIELLARDAEAEGRWPGLSNTQMIAGDD